MVQIELLGDLGGSLMATQPVLAIMIFCQGIHGIWKSVCVSEVFGPHVDGYLPTRLVCFFYYPLSVIPQNL